MAGVKDRQTGSIDIHVAMFEGFVALAGSSFSTGGPTGIRRRACHSKLSECLQELAFLAFPKVGIFVRSSSTCGRDADRILSEYQPRLGQVDR